MMEESAMTDQRIRAFSMLLTGLGAGIVVGGLFAPRAGEVSRKLIARRAQKVRKAVKNAVGDGTRYITRRGTKVRDQAIDLVDRGKGIYRTAEKMVQAAR
jgi:hypothetical protein